jgi:CRISPR-associated endonuclease Csn1
MTTKTGRFRLALDLGSNSIGWVVFALDEDDIPSAVERAGVRIFSNSRNAKTNVPLSVEYREARGARRRRDRFLARKKTILGELKRGEALPSYPADRSAFANSDPYLLRHKALSEKLTPHQLARVILHLSQRRGFKSNRKDKKKEEGGKTLGERIGALKSAIHQSGAETLGSFLYLERRAKSLPTRMRSNEEWYPSRELYQAEFTAIRNAQESYGTLSPKAWDTIQNALFFQRPLAKQPVGRCLFMHDHDRGRRALPSFQSFRLLQQLANLKVYELGKPARSLTEQERLILLEKLGRSKELDFQSARELLHLADARFNLEVRRQGFRAASKLYGDRTGTFLAGKKYFGKAWWNIPRDVQDRIVNQILDSEDYKDECTLKEYLEELGLLDSEQIEDLLNLDEDSFEKGYCEFCPEFLNKLAERMLTHPSDTYDKAVAALGYHHSHEDVAVKSKLPYYGAAIPQSVRVTGKERNPEEREFGKIANPTVHVALNQLRKVVNALLERYCSFSDVIIEVARDLPLGEDGIRELAKENRNNEKQNQKWREMLQELGQRDNYKNRLKLRLWKELGGDKTVGIKCPYSGEGIGMERLFSAEIEVDHILPKSLTFTNHHSNLTLCVRHANQFKGDRAPYEAFTSAQSPYRYEDILARASLLPPAKARKFSPDAMEAFKDKGAFLERQLNDTHYISKVANRYLREISPRVMTSRGRLTAFLRGELRLNFLLSNDGRKDRNDHRHHAVDAFLVGLSAPKSLDLVERCVNGRKNGELMTPVTRLVTEFQKLITTMVVSHRIDHDPAKGLFEDTNYGYATDGRLLVRKPLDKLTSYDAIVDERIKSLALSLMEQGIEDKSEIASAITQKFGAKKVRIFKKDASAVEITHPIGSRRFKKHIVPLDICKVEFWRMPRATELVAASYTRCETLNGVQKKPHPAAKPTFRTKNCAKFCFVAGSETF